MCTGINVLTPTVIIIIIFTFTLLLFGSIYAWFRIKSLTDDQDKTVSKLDPIISNFFRSLSAYSSKIKVCISTMQVIISAGSVLRISPPKDFVNFSRIWSLVNLNLDDILPVSCLKPNDYVSKLLITTLSPIFFTAIIFIAFIAEVLISRKAVLQSNRQGAEQEAYLIFRRLKLRYFSLFLFLTYVILPSVTTSIFKMFICDNVDPNNEDDFDDLYLVADYSIRYYQYK
jgi:hypothetical protein